MKESDNLHACLLLAEMFEAAHDLQSAKEEYMRALDRIKSMKDQPLYMETLLAQIKCHHDYKKAIEDLRQFE